ncbi:MAG: sulfotransferase [Pseudomonadota bacterium]
MSTPSPDSRWTDPSFVIRRVLRRPTVPMEPYQPLQIDAAARGRLQDVALKAQGLSTPPVAFVFGVMPRSGTNYLERMLCQHPDVVTPPDDLRELPFLSALPDMHRFEDSLARFYAPNSELFAQNEWLAYAMAGYLSSVRSSVGETAKLVVIKDPRVRHISLFDAVLPREKAMIVVRDGRYLVDSTIRTWPLKPLGRTFEDVCLEWDAATRAALDYGDTAPAERVRLVKYEEVVADPATRIGELCSWLGIDPAAIEAEALTDAPILGSSTHSRENGGEVGWTPVYKKDGFDPTGRDLGWTDKQKRIFERVCGETQKRAGYDL